MQGLGKELLSDLVKWVVSDQQSPNSRGVFGCVRQHSAAVWTTKGPEALFPPNASSGPPSQFLSFQVPPDQWPSLKSESEGPRTLCRHWALQMLKPTLSLAFHLPIRIDDTDQGSPMDGWMDSLYVHTCLRRTSDVPWRMRQNPLSRIFFARILGRQLSTLRGRGSPPSRAPSSVGHYILILALPVTWVTQWEAVELQGLLMTPVAGSQSRGALAPVWAEEDPCVHRLVESSNSLGLKASGRPMQLGWSQWVSRCDGLLC